jgi:pimeloyl-ACP methyl ester carboxylesterase
MLPHAAEDPVAEISTWPFPETYATFKRLKESEAPQYQNASTIESAELLMSYSVMPFLPRILDVPTLVIVAENDDLTLWDLEIEAYNAIPAAKKRLVTVGGSTHMTLYSDRSLLAQAGSSAAAWFSEHLGRAAVPATDSVVR